MEPLFTLIGIALGSSGLSAIIVAILNHHENFLGLAEGIQSLCFSSVDNRETVYLYSYPSYFSEGLTGSEVKATNLNYSDITKTEVEFNVIGNTISFMPSVPVHLVADSIIKEKASGKWPVEISNFKMNEADFDKLYQYIKEA